MKRKLSFLEIVWLPKAIGKSLNYEKLSNARRWGFTSINELHKFSHERSYGKSRLGIIPAKVSLLAFDSSSSIKNFLLNPTTKKFSSGSSALGLQDTFLHRALEMYSELLRCVISCLEKLKAVNSNLNHPDQCGVSNNQKSLVHSPRD